MFEFFSDLGGFIMKPLYYVISAVLLAWHRVFGELFGPASGVAWVLSIVGLTLVVRAALIPLFVKQIKSSRNMQLLQPRVKELQKKYGHDRERFAQEQMKLYKETGTNPLASCMPLLLQMPIFLALFRLIDQAAKDPSKERGLMTVKLNTQFGDATLFGGQISDTFLESTDPIVRVLAATLVVAMFATTFITQRQLMSKNMPADALSGPYAQQQKMLLYVLPVVFAVGGFWFPIGVLFYWTTSNLWTMGQQFWVIRNNPAPNTSAYDAKVARDEAKRKRKGLPDPKAAEPPAAEPPAAEPPRRQQPKKQSRSQRRRQSPPGGSAGKPGQPGKPAQRKQPSEDDDPPGAAPQK